MGFWKRVSLFVPAGIGMVAFFLLASAWFEIQAVRWGYKNQEIRGRLDDLAKREAMLDQRLQQNLSLPRLDRLAKEKFGLQIPLPTQIVMIPDR